MKNMSKPKQKERGQSMIELALTISFLMVLLAGTIDLGHAFFAWLAMRDAVQEGATYGAIDPSADETAIQTYVVSLVTTDVITDPAAILNVGVSIPNDRCLGYHSDINGEQHPNTITVSVEYQNFPITTPLLGAIIGDTIAIRTTIHDTIIVPECE